MRIEPDQRRRLQFIAATLLALTLVAAGLVVAFRNDSPKEINAQDDPSPTTLQDSGFVVPTLPGDPVPTTLRTTTTRPANGGTAASTSSTTSTTAKASEVENKERKCVNTTASQPEPAADDWTDYWTTKPEPNYPLEMAICVDDATPKVGQKISLGLLARDADMKITTEQCDVRVTWEGPPRDCRQDILAQPKGDPGKHEINSKTKNQITLEFTRTFDESGERTISVSVWSGPDDGKRYAYANYSSLEMTINVHK